MVYYQVVMKRGKTIYRHENNTKMYSLAPKLSVNIMEQNKGKESKNSYQKYFW